jgi:hypothetical protein
MQPYPDIFDCDGVLVDSELLSCPHYRPGRATLPAACTTLAATGCFHVWRIFGEPIGRGHGVIR